MEVPVSQAARKDELRRISRPQLGCLSRVYLVARTVYINSSTAAVQRIYDVLQLEAKYLQNCATRLDAPRVSIKTDVPTLGKAPPGEAAPPPAEGGVNATACRPA